MTTFRLTSASLALATLIIVAPAGACQTAVEGAPEGASVVDDSAMKASADPHPIWGDEDLSSVVERFQGKTTIKVLAADLVGREGGGSISEQVVLEVAGDKVIATAEEGGRVEGTLRAVSPCQIAIDIPESKRRRPYSFAANGDDFWVGTTDAGAKLRDGSWLICSYFGYVTLKDGACTFHSSRGLSWESKSFEEHEIECGVDGDTLKYQSLLMGDPQKPNAESITIVGDALLSSPLKWGQVAR